MIMHRFNCNHTVSKVVMTNTQLKNENSEEKRKNTKVSIELLKTFCLNYITNIFLKVFAKAKLIFTFRR